MNLKTVAHKLFKVRGDKLPVICIFGRKDIHLVTPAIEDYEEKRLDCRCYSSDSHLDQVLIRDKPNVLITIGHRSSYTNMIKAPF